MSLSSNYLWKKIMISARAIVLQDKLASNYKIIPYKSYDMGIMRPLSNLFSKSTHVQEFRLKLWLQSDFKIILLYLPYRIFMFEFWRQNHWPFRSTIFKTIQTYHVVHSCCCSENLPRRVFNWFLSKSALYKAENVNNFSNLWHRAGYE